MYFDNTSEQVMHIRKGMDFVLGGKLNAIAYLPLKNFSERINGSPDYSIEVLKSITKYSYANGNVKNKEQEEWFWEILSDLKD